MPISQKNQPKARDCEVIAVRVAPALMLAIKAAAKAEGFVSKSGHPLPGRWAESKMKHVVRRVAANAPQSPQVTPS